MNNEPAHTEIAEDDNEAATKGFVRSQLRSVESNLRVEIEGVDRRLMRVEDDVKDLKKEVKSTRDATNRVLDIVQSIDKNTRGLPAKVERLH